MLFGLLTVISKDRVKDGEDVIALELAASGIFQGRSYRTSDGPNHRPNHRPGDQTVSAAGPTRIRTPTCEAALSL